MAYRELKQLVMETAKKAYRIGLMAGTSGNFSLRVPQTQKMVITPSAIDYDDMVLEDIVVMNLTGEMIEGNRRPSSEWRMHAAIYEELPHVNAVVHTHSPYASSFAVLSEPIPVVLIEMAVLGGDVPVTPFAMSGTKELGVKVARTLHRNGRHACLLENHGALTVGNTMDLAYKRAIYLEDAAKIYHLARSIGEPKKVAEPNIQEMIKKLEKAY
jgi:L-ribulose-5-phosphate 4-epimerase